MTEHDPAQHHLAGTRHIREVSSYVRLRPAGGVELQVFYTYDRKGVEGGLSWSDTYEVLTMSEALDVLESAVQCVGQCL